MPKPGDATKNLSIKKKILNFVVQTFDQQWTAHFEGHM
jgi:hypothetical protein